MGMYGGSAHTSGIATYNMRSRTAPDTSWAAAYNMRSWTAPYNLHNDIVGIPHNHGENQTKLRGLARNITKPLTKQKKP